MKEIKVFVDDDTEAISITTISNKEKYKNINAMAFDLSHTSIVQMPESICSQDN